MEIQHDRLLKPSDIFGLGALGSDLLQVPRDLGVAYVESDYRTTASRTTTNQRRCDSSGVAR